MTHTVSWLIEDSVILERFDGNVTRDDLEISQETVLQMLDQSSAPTIHALVDIRGMEKALLTAGQIMKIGPLTSALRHSKTGHVVVVVKDNPLHIFLLRVLSTVGRNLNMSRDMQTAIDHLGVFVEIPDDVRAKLLT